MNANDTEKAKRPVGAERPFPWRCRHCGRTEVMLTTVPYDAEVRHDGRTYVVSIPRLEIPICRACEKKIFTERVDKQINEGLRAHLRLLAPQEMREGLDRLNMTQKEAADHLGIAEATLSR